MQKGLFWIIFTNKASEKHKFRLSPLMCRIPFTCERARARACMRKRESAFTAWGPRAHARTFTVHSNSPSAAVWSGCRGSIAHRINVPSSPAETGHQFTINKIRFFSDVLKAFQKAWFKFAIHCFAYPLRTAGKNAAKQQADILCEQCKTVMCTSD